MKNFVRKRWPVMFIFAIWLIFSSQYLFKGLIPFPSKYLVTFFPPWSANFGMPVKNNAMPDVITQIYPWKKLTIDIWKTGNIPLWNPYSFSGTTHASNYQTAIFSPFNFLFFFLPQIHAWSLMVLLQPLLAGLFMYLLLRALDKSLTASLIGSIAFMFCGFMVVWMAYATLGYAVLWLPLALFFVQKQFTKRSWWNLSLLSITLALALLSGHFQMSLYVVLATLSFILFKTLSLKQWRRGIILIFFVILGILLASAQLLPSFEAYWQSSRSSSFSKGEIIPFQYLITLIAPDFFGNPVTRNDWFGHYAEWASYLGIVPFFLALYVVISKKDNNEWFFVITAIFSLLLATPTFLNDILFWTKLPVLSTSSASRIIILTSFSLCILAGFGLDKISSDWSRNKARRIIIFGLITDLFISYVWILLFWGKPFLADKLLIAKRNFILPSLLSFIVINIFVLGVISHRKIRIILPYVLLILTSFDLLRYASKWMPFDPKEFIFPEMKVISFLQKEIGPDRVFGNVGNELGSFFKIPLIEGYDALYQARYGQFIAAASSGQIEAPGRSVVLMNKHGQYTEQALRLLGVKYYLHRLSDGHNIWAYPVWEYPNYESIYKDESYEVFKNTQAYPRVFLASSYKVISDDQQIIEALFKSQLDLRETIVVEKKPDIEPSAGFSKVEINSYRPNEVKIDLDTEAPKLLFLSDVFDSGWKATVDGLPTKVLRADFDFRAVALREGKHLVRFYYDPTNFKLGVAVSLLVVSFLIIGSLKIIYENRNF